LIRTHGTNSIIPNAADKCKRFFLLFFRNYSFFPAVPWCSPQALHQITASRGMV